MFFTFIRIFCLFQKNGCVAAPRNKKKPLIPKGRKAKPFRGTTHISDKSRTLFSLTRKTPIAPRREAHSKPGLGSELHDCPAPKGRRKETNAGRFQPMASLL